MLLNVKQVAERLAVSTAVVYRLIETGKLVAHRIGLGRGTLRVTEEQLAEFLNENKVQREPAQTRKQKLKHIEF